VETVRLLALLAAGALVPACAVSPSEHLNIAPRGIWKGSVITTNSFEVKQWVCRVVVEEGEVGPAVAVVKCFWDPERPGPLGRGDPEDQVLPGGGLVESSP
jgi:hypothetical protein